MIMHLVNYGSFISANMLIIQLHSFIIEVFKCESALWEYQWVVMAYQDGS